MKMANKQNAITAQIKTIARKALSRVCKDIFIVNESSTPMLFNVHCQNGCDNVDQEHEELLSGHDTFIKHENDKHKKAVDIRVSYSA